MIDIICIDGKFSIDSLEFFAKHGVVVPIKETQYTIRDVIINSSGETGLLLEELKNPPVPFKHPILGVASMETNWHVNRFRMLNGDEINTKELVNDLKTFNKSTFKDFTIKKEQYERIEN